MAQQTAVEWYADELFGLMLELATNTITESEYHTKRRAAKEQAKQMEKEQIVNAYFEGFREGRGIDNIDISGTIFIEDTKAERYYDITYQPT